MSLAYANKPGPLRSTKDTVRHKILPEEPTTTSGADGESGSEYLTTLPWHDGQDDDGDDSTSRFAHIPEGSMRRDAQRLTRKGRANLPRVTAYSTASSYKFPELFRWLQSRRESHGTNVLRFDDCLYTTYTFANVDEARGISSGREDAPTGDLLGVPELQTISEEGEEGDKNAPRTRRQYIPEVYFMEYGTVVIWGMSVTEERRLLREIRRFEVERLAIEDVEVEDLNWYLADYSRIYNDVITLRRGSSYMTKLSISHALAQSAKISFFESVIEATIDTTKDIPESIAQSGKIGMPPGDIMKHIGHLFILRMNMHLVGSIVDAPEIFWSQPDLEPLYAAVRSYLEIPQRIDLLNTRVEVLQDMLQLLKDQVTSSHSEWLEIIVIILIVLEYVSRNTNQNHSWCRNK
ncbi:sporulation protein rmd1 [Malassezia cuniculi]|uniref:Sporulation protein rmd1 n=1 Tax=Malassezia cuniculi TaxID=948313 RepID=A0AAF0J5Y5_9BASI|nr:sporulation protein rmd1 [Malassezia cuniculi]